MTRIIKQKKIVLLLMIYMMLFTQNDAQARLTILSPLQMVENSDLIIAGTVKNLVTTESERNVTIEIDSVLKGEYDEKEISIESRPLRYGWTEFPSKGKRVMVLLTKEENNSYSLTADVNNVAVINENGEIEVSNRGGTDKWPVDSYDRFYTLFFKENYKPDHLLLQKPDGLATGKFTENKLFYQTINIIILALLLAFGFWVFIDCKRRGLSRFSSLIWSLIVVFIPLVGIGIYFFYRRKRWL